MKYTSSLNKIGIEMIHGMNQRIEIVQNRDIIDSHVYIHEIKFKFKYDNHRIDIRDGMKISRYFETET